jgi:lactate permease
MGRQLSLLSWCTAALPLALILLLMVRRRWSGAKAGFAGVLCAGGIGVIHFGADADVLLVATAKSVALTFHVLYIIWPALLLYHLVETSGAIRSIGAGVSSLTEDHILQLLILGFAFSSFLQGVAGFGVPVAVVAPLLIGLGFPPLQATAVPLLGHAWAVTMGDLASSFQALLAVTALPAYPLGLWTALFLGLSCVATGFCVAHLHAGILPIRRCMGAILALSLAMALTQFFLAYMQYWILASFCSGMVGVGFSLLVARLSRGEYPNLLGLFPAWPSPWGRRTPHREIPRLSRTGMSFHLAFSAYYGLVVIVMVATLVPSLRENLTALTTSINFPGTSTSLGWKMAPSKYDLRVLEHPGAYLLSATVVAWIIYRVAGFWEEAQWRQVLSWTVRDGLPTSLGVLFMVVMAMIMAYTGMTFLLAQGTITVTGQAYPIVSPFVGLLGCFMTGSNTNSNVLFGVLQRDIAALLGKDPVVLAALQTTGGSLGSMVAPAKVLVASATAGLQGKEGEVIRCTLKYCLSITLCIGLLGWVVLLFP